MKTINTERIPILVWGESADEATLAQARNLANLPFAVGHVALMPDAHVGYGMPIGGVVAAQGRVIPHAVGLDIGCGVQTWRTGVSASELMPLRDEVLLQIQRSVPQGFNWHSASQAEKTDLFDELPDIALLREQRERAERQLGTLGGGNHFIELEVDAHDEVWVTIHSGSRNVGKQVAEHYDRLARELDHGPGAQAPPEWGLASLEVAGDAGAEYLVAMDWCMRFAAENRRLIGDAVRSVLRRYFPDAEPAAVIDVHHNYAATERHFGTQVVVHRKGAVRACGPVVVPGSMGTASYVGEGLGNPEAFESCSHGAGRAMGRKAATRELSRERVLETLEAAGVRLVSASKGSVAEEAPAAYKDIEDVMEWQRDLVQRRIRLLPIGVVKG